MNKKKFYTVRAEAGKITEIDIFGYIGDDEESVSYAMFRDELRNISKNETHCIININSGGGSMVEGFAIYDEMQRSTMQIETRVVGMAASMAGIIALGGRRLLMSRNASFMTHKPKGIEMGESSSFRSYADFMDSLEKRAVFAFCAKSGKPEDEVKKWFKSGEDTWFDAEQCISLGIADGYLTDNVKPPKEFKKPMNIVNEAEAWKVYNKLTDNQIKHKTMKKTLLVLSAFNIKNTLTEESTDEAFAVVIENALKAKDDKIMELTTKLDSIENAKIDKVISDGVNAQKFSKEEGETYRPMLKQNFEAVSSLIDKLPGRQDINDMLNRQNAGGVSGKGGSAATEAKPGALPENKADWNLGQWEEHDPKGLQVKMNSDPVWYKQAVKDFYGTDI